MLTKKEKREIGRKSALKHWGLRVVMSIFPVTGEKHRVTLCYKGKEYVVAGKDRLVVLDSAFKKWQEIIDENL